MKRFFTFCMILSLTMPFVGCEKKTEVKKQETTTTPEGSTTATDTQKVETTGDNPPATPK